MRLGLDIVGNGAPAAGWWMPAAKTDAALDIRMWKETTQAAERACMHALGVSAGRDRGKALGEGR